MPRRHRRDLPRWRRGHAVTVRPVQLTGRQARTFAREYARVTRTDPAGANRTLAQTGAWRFRRHLIPFAWLAVTLAASVILRATPRPVPYAIFAAVIGGGLAVRATRHLSPFARHAAELAVLVTLAWLPALAAAGFGPPVPALLAVTWAPFTLAWVLHYGWRPAAPGSQQDGPADRSDAATWERLARRRKWSGTLGSLELIPGGRKYPILLDGAETHIGQVIAEPRAIAAAWDKPQTEAYAEPAPTGVESRGYLTILKTGTLGGVREWDGRGFAEDGIARIGRFADGADARIRCWVPRDGTRHGLAAGTTGAGKSALLDLLIWLALTSPVPVVPVILDPQNGQSLPQWRGKLLYAAGVDECARMLRGIHAGMLDRSARLASMWWDDDGHAVRGMEFYDPQLSGLPVVMPIIDEKPMLLSGGGNARLAQEMVRIVSDAAKLYRKAGGSLWGVAQVPSLSELGDQALRSMMVGGNVICLRTGDRVSAGMVGLEADPSALPKYFPDGEATGGLGYVISVDNRQAPFRTDMVPRRMRRQPAVVPALEPEFLEVMDRAMRGALTVPSGPARPRPAPDALGYRLGPLNPPAELDPESSDAPDGRRCVDAVWQVLSDSGQPMERGEVIRWVSELATTGWGRDKPFSIRAVTDALARLAAGDGGRTVTKIRDGVYQASPREE
jgi:hypothetical protein